VTYEQTISWLYSLQGKLGMDFRLERLGPVLESLEHPERSFPSLHVGGTNGKGSTSAMLRSILEQAGYCTGLYTSPHLRTFRERIRVGSDLISESAVVAHVDRVREAARDANVELTYFEIATLIAFIEFRSKGIDLAVVEVGLGGRLDATNVVDSIGVAITSIGLDHGEYLGDTIEKVAWEKAGILKPGVPAVVGPIGAAALGALEERAGEIGIRLQVCGRDFDAEPARGVALSGRHQLENAAVARALLKSVEAEFPVSDLQVGNGLARVRWPGRFEVVTRDPFTILDAGHNPDAMSALVAALDEIHAPEPRVLVYGVMADKDWREMLNRLSGRFDRVVCVPVKQARALDPKIAADYLRARSQPTVATCIEEGLNEATRLAGVEGTVVVTGSVFLVGEVYEGIAASAEDIDVSIDR